jgi:nucleotide-binding universal stress UspA family protein
MPFNQVGHILCAVRGVPQSRATVTKAINLATEHQARLTFVHVNNADFLMSAGPTMTSLTKVKKQIHSLGEFAMLVLCDRAQRRGVENVDYVLREGRILPQILETLSEFKPDILVIGRPFVTDAGVFSLKESDVENFIQEVENNLNITVIPVEAKVE